MKKMFVVRPLLVMGILIIALVAEALADKKVKSDPQLYQAGLRNSPDNKTLDNKKQKRLLESLQAKTGFTALHFDTHGFLVIGEEKQFNEGSATARKLLLRAINSPYQILLEDHSYSDKIVFASLDKSINYINLTTQARIERKSINIDFSDFSKLIGAKEVVASFDLGMTVLHELAHAVLGLSDAVTDWEDVGDCERYINTIRQELNLPERQQYVASTNTIMSPHGGSSRIAALPFALTNYKDGRLKTIEYILSWDVKRVGVGANGIIGDSSRTMANINKARRSLASVP